MAHNINSMAYYGKEPWHKLGHAIPARATSGQMIVAAGLDWEVTARGARGAGKDKKGRYSMYEIVREPRPHTKEREILLGVASGTYVPLQNCEAFDFFDLVVGDNKAVFETAGSLGRGECVWVLAKMPAAMEIVPGDECRRYLLLSNRHDGKGSVTVKFTSIRVVCQNTLMLALKDGQNAYRVRHSKLMTERLAQVGEILHMAKKVYEECGMLFRKLAATSLARNRLDMFLQVVYPLTEPQKKRGTRPEKWVRIDQLLEESEDLKLPGVKDTMWAAYNAVTQFEDYRQTRTPEDPSARLNRVWFGAGADTKLNALEAARDMVAA